MKTFIFSALALGMMASCSNTEVEMQLIMGNR